MDMKKISLIIFLSSICKNNKRDVLLTNQHVPELKIHYDTELQTSTDLSNETINLSNSPEIENGRIGVSTELNVPNTENSFENADENMVPDEGSLKIDRITVYIPRRTASHRYCFICQKECSKKIALYSK